MFIDFREVGGVGGERERERKREMWERNIDWLPPICALTEDEPTTFCCTGQCSNQQSHTGQATDDFLTLQKYGWLVSFFLLLKTDIRKKRERNILGYITDQSTGRQIWPSQGTSLLPPCWLISQVGSFHIISVEAWIVYPPNSSLPQISEQNLFGDRVFENVIS